MLSLPWSHLEHAQLLLGLVVFYLEASREVRLEAELGSLVRIYLLLHVVAVYVKFRRFVGSDAELLTRSVTMSSWLTEISSGLISPSLIETSKVWS